MTTKNMLILAIRYIGTASAFFFYQLFTGYGALFHRLDGRAVSSQIQGATLSSTAIVTAISEDTANEAHVTTSRPIPYDAEQRYTRLQRDGLVSRRDKSTTHFQEETQPLRRNMSSSGVEPLVLGGNGMESMQKKTRFPILSYPRELWHQKLHKDLTICSLQLKMRMSFLLVLMEMEFCETP